MAKTIYILRATAARREFTGVSTFVHKRAFADKSKAEAYLPAFVADIESTTGDIVSYCDVKATITELELVE